MRMRWPSLGGNFNTELVPGRRFPSFEQAELRNPGWIAFERLHDRRPAPVEAEALRAPAADDEGHGPCGPVEAVRARATRGAPAGLGTMEHAT